MVPAAAETASFSSAGWCWMPTNPRAGGMCEDGSWGWKEMVLRNIHNIAHFCSIPSVYSTTHTQQRGKKSISIACLKVLNNFGTLGRHLF